MKQAKELAERIFGGLYAKVTVENAAKEIYKYSREVAVNFMIEMDDGLPKEDWYKIFDDWRRKQK